MKKYTLIKVALEQKDLDYITNLSIKKRHTEGPSTSAKQFFLRHTKPWINKHKELNIPNYTNTNSLKAKTHSSITNKIINAVRINKLNAS